MHYSIIVELFWKITYKYGSHILRFKRVVVIEQVDSYTND